MGLLRLFHGCTASLGPFFLRDYPYEKTGFPRNGLAQKLHEKFGGEERAPIIYVEKQGLMERKGLISRALFKDYPYLEP